MNLVPAQRTDKNGRVQTRWVKPDKPAPARAIPAPDAAILAALQSPASPFTTLPSKVDGIMSVWDGNPIAHTNYTLEDFDPWAVAEVDRLLTETVEPGHTNPPMVIQMSVGSALKLMADEGLSVEFDNLAVFGPLVYPQSRHLASDHINFLHEYTGRETNYLRDASDDERERAKAMISFVAGLDTLDLGSSTRMVEYIDDYEETSKHISPSDAFVARFVWENPELADDVLDVLRQEGGPLPLNLIEERLAHPESALRDGVL